MNCNEASEKLSAAVLGDLGRGERRALHAHLAVCERCLEEESELHRSLHLLRAHAEVEPAAGFHDAVLARAAAVAAAETPAAVAPLRRVGRLTQTLLTAAATALIVVGLQTVLESWRATPARLSPDLAVHGASLTGPGDRQAPRLLEGTLFDRRRDLPEDVRRFQEQLRRGDARLPLDL